MSKKTRLQLSTLSKKDFPFKDKLTQEQEDLVNKLFRSQRVIVDSESGTGKSTVATQAMIALLKNKRVERIYYVVFPVQERALGYLPGEVKDKVKEYAVPFIQALREAGIDPSELDLDKVCDEQFEGNFKVVPHTFLRGRTIKDAGIILDEAQNGTVDELQKSFTRITDDCYVVIAGHEGQTDISKERSGFAMYKNHFRQGKISGEFKDIEFAELTVNFRGKFSKFSDKINMTKHLQRGETK